MKMLSVSDLQARVSLPSLAPILTAVGIALETATTQLQALLGTGSWAYGQYTDTFLVDYDILRQVSGPLVIRLNHGLVDAAIPLVVTYASTLSGLVLGSLVEASLVRVDADDGLAYIERDLNKCYVSVVYSAGLKSKVAPDTDVYAGVPSWLVDLAVQVALESYYRGRNIEDSKSQISGLSPYFGRLIMQYSRLFPYAFRALWK